MRDQYRGKLFRLADGLVVVPFKREKGGSYCVVVHQGESVYPVGDYNLWVPHADLDTSSAEGGYKYVSGNEQRSAETVDLSAKGYL